MGGIEHLQKSTDVSFTQLETDIGGRRSEGSLALMTLPEYVEHQDGVSRAGALSAEAVLRDYEVAAKEIEAMGAELIDAAKKCQAMTAEVHTAIAYMRGTAAAYREEAKKLFKRIEDCALFTQDVRKTCEDIKRRMMEGNSTTELSRQGSIKDGE
jgi:hypothetical protein